MAKVTILKYDDGVTAFQWGTAGDPYVFEATDDDSIAIAFTKAVNDGIESGDEIEGEAAIAVAEVLKATGDVVWGDEAGFNDLRADVQNALPDLGKDVYAYVEDITVSGSKALICVSGQGIGEGGGYGAQQYVASFTVSDDEVVVDPRANWVEAEREDRYVAKAGRMFSGQNLDAMREAHEALGALIAAGQPKIDDEPATKAAGSDTDLSYTITKSNSPMRYTLGPLYAPTRKDAHGEWIEDDTLHKSLHEFVRDSAETGRRINLQHGDLGDVQCGEWVEAVRWPYDHTIVMKAADGTDHEVDMPAGTVYLGVIWDEDYWDVKKNAPKDINGYSLGGRAVKIRDDEESTKALESMGYKVAKNAATGPALGKAEIELAVELGEAQAHKGFSAQLLDILRKGAENGGVTINEGTVLETSATAE